MIVVWEMAQILYISVHKFISNPLTLYVAQIPVTFFVFSVTPDYLFLFHWDEEKMRQEKKNIKK